jgi:hypothetical protein
MSRDPDDALAKYHSPVGWEGDLVEAAALVEESGDWATLKAFVLKGHPETEYFVAAVARMKSVDEAERTTVLTEIAKNPDPNTRGRLAEVLEGG